MKFSVPIKNPRITQSYSPKHPGIDYGHPDGTPIYASEAGTVLVSKNTETRSWIANSNSDPFPHPRELKSDDYGNYIKIKHDWGYESLYAHLKKDSIQVTEGQTILKGQFIGKVGSTGNSSGNHLHFEIRKDGKTISPVALLNEEEPMADFKYTEEDMTKMRLQRDENWSRGEEFRVKLGVAAQVIEDLQKQVERITTADTANREIIQKKQEEIDRLKQQSSEQPTVSGALQAFTLFLQLAMKGQWK